MSEDFFNYNLTDASAFDPTKHESQSILRPNVDFISNRCDNSKKSVPFDNMVCFIDEKKIVCYIASDCVISLHPEASTNAIHNSRKWNKYFQVL